MRELTEREARDATHNQDAHDQGRWEVRHTDPDAWLRDLKADYEAEAISPPIVRLAVTAGQATLQQLFPDRWIPGGTRDEIPYRSKYVEASYIARGQLVKLSAYCGIAYTGPAAQASPAKLVHTTASAEKIQQTTRKLQSHLAPLKDLEVRGGGVYLEDGPWTPHPDQEIVDPPEIACITCIELIYFANGAWRHKATGQAEALIEEPCGRCGGTGHQPSRGNRPDGSLCLACNGTRVAKRLHHLADPEIDGRTV